jgi:hypothetical protein
VLAKLSTLGRIDSELRALEGALRERRPLTVLREAGITACPRCAAIHGSEDRFCPNCGLSVSRHADLPIAGASPATADGAGQPSAPRPSAPSPPAAPPPQGHAGPAPAPPGRGYAAPAPATVAQAPDSGAAPPGPGEGRSPSPPPTRTMRQANPAQGAGDGQQVEESTEILHPQAPGS